MAYSIVKAIYISFFNQVPIHNPILDVLVLQLELPSSYYHGGFVPS